VKLATLRKTLITACGVIGSLSVLVVGCSSKDEATSNASIDGGPFCPSSLATALDSKSTCQGEGFECPIGYSCGAFAQQAYCTCTKGKWACKSSRGEVVDDAAKAPCNSPGSGSDKECPQSQNGTEGQSCKTPGLQCFYKGFTCPESPDSPKQDVCQCVTQPLPDGGPTLQFRCEIQYCNPRADASISKG